MKTFTTMMLSVLGAVVAMPPQTVTTVDVTGVQPATGQSTGGTTGQMSGGGTIQTMGGPGQMTGGTTGQTMGGPGQSMGGGTGQMSGGTTGQSSWTPTGGASSWTPSVNQGWGQQTNTGFRSPLDMYNSWQQQQMYYQQQMQQQRQQQQRPQQQNAGMNPWMWLMLPQIDNQLMRYMVMTGGQQGTGVINPFLLMRLFN